MANTVILESKNKGQYYQVLDLKDLQPMAPLETNTYWNVWKSINKDGMINPIVVQDIKTISGIDGDLKKISAMKIDEKCKYAIWGGNNRYHFAIDNNYEKISCLVAPNDEIRSQLVDDLFMEMK